MILLNAAGYPTTGVSMGLGEAGAHRRGNTYKTWYLSGTLGAGGTVLLEVSPDTFYQPASGSFNPATGVLDANSRWFTIATMTVLGYYTENNVYRKVRAVISGGDGTTSLTLEGVGQ